MTVVVCGRHYIDLLYLCFSSLSLLIYRHMLAVYVGFPGHPLMIWHHTMLSDNIQMTTHAVSVFL